MTPTPNAETALPREAYTLLAQANLLRMRGRWDEAVEACMAALRLAPESASAQSLLGDIYENRGRPDDAIQWYRMALDVSPDSPADRLKLDRLLDAKQLQLAAAHTLAAPPVVPRPPLPMPALLTARGPERLLRWGAWLVIALTVLVVVLMGAAMSLRRPGRIRQTITAPPVVVSDPAAPVAPDPAPAPPAPDAADPAEQAMLQSLQQDAQLAAQDIVPVGVQMDPRQSAVTLTIQCPPPVDASVRQALLRDSVAALLAAGRVQGDRVPAWTVRCLLAGAAAQGDTSPPPPSLALVADATPAALAALGSSPLTLSGPQLLPAFHNLWWSPALGP